MLVDEQKQIALWLARQPFGPGQKPWEPLIGLAEECGELCRAHLKAHQKIRGTTEEHEQKGKDSIGDCVIYLLGFCNNVGIEAKDCQVVHNFSDTFHTPEYSILKLISKVGDLAGLHAHDYEGISSEDCHIKWAVGEIISWLISYCKAKKWSFQECVNMAMSEVMARDWNANSANGVVHYTDGPVYADGPKTAWQWMVDGNTIKSTTGRYRRIVNGQSQVKYSDGGIWEESPYMNKAKNLNSEPLCYQLVGPNE
jgi:NTP pyrophosphatase (non-canonical NTP hydrolase)